MQSESTADQFLFMALVAKSPTEEVNAFDNFWLADTTLTKGLTRLLSSGAIQRFQTGNSNGADSAQPRNTTAATFCQISRIAGLALNTKVVQP